MLSPCFVTPPNIRLKLSLKERPLRVTNKLEFLYSSSSLLWISESVPFSFPSSNWNSSNGFTIIHSSGDLAASPDNVTQSSEYFFNATTAWWAFKACFKHSPVRTFGEFGAAANSMISSRNLIRKYFSAAFKSFMAWLSCGINSFSVLFSTLNHTNPTEQMLTNTKHSGMVSSGCFAIPSPNHPKKRSRRRTNQLQNDDHRTQGLKRW